MNVVRLHRFTLTNLYFVELGSIFSAVAVYIGIEWVV